VPGHHEGGRGRAHRGVRGGRRRTGGGGVLILEPGLTVLLLDGRQAADHEDDLRELRAEVYGGDGTTDGTAASTRDNAEAARLLGVWRRQPGFALAEARHGGFLVGYACGMPLRPSTSWWRDVTTPLPDRLTAEYPGRTFAVTELAVRAAWRRQGIGGALYRRLLANRPEERATLTVAPDASAAQSMLRGWGWTRVARTRDPAGGPAVFDILVTGLPT
jgi:ribosomal protein S18 acetylase RimI-like enzyme